MKEDHITKEQLRIKAIEFYKSNWEVTHICSVLGCSRSWFYKWLNRYIHHKIIR